MRIWDVHPRHLCGKHLLGEHRELHAIWNIITQNKKGYSQHPETKRWVGKLAALWARHAMQVEEMRRRGWRSGIFHQSPLDINLVIGSSKPQDEQINTIQEQIKILAAKDCTCYVGI